MPYDFERSDRRENIKYILSVTTYEETIFEDKSNIQIRQMRLDIESKMQRYPKEIADYLRRNPNAKPFYTYEELKQMTYNELWQIRKLFGIKSPKKVKSSEQAPKIAQKAKEVIQKTPTNALAATIITDSIEHDEIEDYQFITLAEAEAMYGEDLTDEYLESRGFKLYEPISRTYSEATQKQSLIAAILESGLKTKGKPLTPEKLRTLDIRELHYLLYTSSKISEDLDSKGLRKKP